MTNITKDKTLNIFDEVGKVNQAVLFDESGFTAINFKQFLVELSAREKKEILTEYLINFINTLGRNKSGGNNAISRLQYFLNAYIQEVELEKENSDILEFIGDDHYFLVKGYKGTDEADFYLHASNGNMYTIDVKIFFSEKRFIEQREANNINFHNADYCLVYLIDSKGWRFCRKVDGYLSLSTIVVFMGSDPWLSEIKLPKTLTLIKFFTDELTSGEFSRLSDIDVPSTVSYTFYE
jgi:hypothetical protein